MAPMPFQSRENEMLQNRIPPPLLTVFTAAAMWYVAPPGLFNPYLTVAAAVTFALAGIIGLPALIAFQRSRTTIDPIRIDRTTTLVTHGVYRFTRNPMYLSLVLLLVAWAIWLASPYAALGPILFLLFLDRFQIAPEEKAMYAKFGDSYNEYRMKVRRWI
jgi:protein-S-isoprenylcysteine O-methyltransferase Ste14